MASLTSYLEISNEVVNCNFGTNNSDKKWEKEVSDAMVGFYSLGTTQGRDTSLHVPCNQHSRFESRRLQTWHKQKGGAINEKSACDKNLCN